MITSIVDGCVRGHLESHLKLVHEKLDALRSDHDGLAARFDTLEGRFDTLDTKVDRILERME